MADWSAFPDFRFKALEVGTLSGFVLGGGPFGGHIVLVFFENWMLGFGVEDRYVCAVVVCFGVEMVVIKG
jgi:hypothetical protein